MFKNLKNLYVIGDHKFLVKSNSIFGDDIIILMAIVHGFLVTTRYKQRKNSNQKFPPDCMLNDMNSYLEKYFYIIYFLNLGGNLWIK
jgi:hypothetical protein